MIRVPQRISVENLKTLNEHKLACLGILLTAKAAGLPFSGFLLKDTARAFTIKLGKQRIRVQCF